MCKGAFFLGNFGFALFEETVVAGIKLDAEYEISGYDFSDGVNYTT